MAPRQEGPHRDDPHEAAEPEVHALELRVAHEHVEHAERHEREHRGDRRQPARTRALGVRHQRRAREAERVHARKWKAW